MAFPLPKGATITNSMLPSQEHTRQNFPAPRQFGPNDWKFSVDRAQKLNWLPGVKMTNTTNYFHLREPSRKLQSGMFNPLTGQEPTYGHVNYTLNPLDQEQTNAQASAYQLQKSTRVAGNMSPAYSMNFPTYQYPVNNPPNIWVNVYNGSTRKFQGMR